MFDFDREPDHVNAAGVKWWRDSNAEAYAKQEDRHGTSLPDVRVWYVECPDGHKSYVITRGQEFVFDTHSYEGIGVHIDVMKILERDK